MRKTNWVFGVLCLGSMLGAPALAGSPSLETVAEKCLPTVVKISSSDADKTPASPKPEDQPNTSFGSGVIIDAKGAILTSEHVVKGMASVRITFQDGRTANTTQIYHDPDTDLALVRLAPRDAVGLTAAGFADSEGVRILQRVIAIGSPFDLSGSVSYGHISGLHRRIDDATIKYQDFIQTDAAINPGSSGGPLLDDQGNVIGIVTAVRSKNGTFAGVAFATPSNLARVVSANLLLSGKVPRAYLGVRTASLSVQEKETQQITNGVRVIELPDSDTAPSRKAGLKVGDIILKVGGQSVVDPQDLVMRSVHLLANRPVALAVLRDGQRLELSAYLLPLAENATPVRARQQVKALGLWGEPFSEQAAHRYGYEAGKAPKRGFLITDLEKKSLGEIAELRIGTMILEIERTPVGTAAEVQTQLTAARLTAGALLLIGEPSGNTSYAIVKK